MIDLASWLAGFVEGEGTFSFRQNRGNGKRTYPYFAVVNTDETSIRLAQKILGFGRISITHPKGRKTKFSLYVEDKIGLEKIADFFEGRLLTALKKEQFKTFKKILGSCYVSKEELSEIRRRGAQRKWDEPKWRLRQQRIMRTLEYRQKVSEGVRKALGLKARRLD